MTAHAMVPHSHKVVVKAKTIYNGEISVIDHFDNRFLIAESRQGAVLQGYMNLKNTTDLNTEYLQIMTMLTSLQPKKNSIYNLGLGGGGLVRYFLDKDATVQISSAEIDSTIAQISENYFNVKNKNHKILIGDGYQVLKGMHQKFDIIWVDAETPKMGPSVYVKASDLTELKEHLEDTGVIVAYLGEAKSEGQVSLLEKGYKSTFSHGIRIKSNAVYQNSLITEMAHSMQIPKMALIKDSIYFVAVGNQPTLNCKDFDKKFKIYSKNKAAFLKKSNDDICQEI